MGVHSQYAETIGYHDAYTLSNKPTLLCRFGPGSQ